MKEQNSNIVMVYKKDAEHKIFRILSTFEMLTGKECKEVNLVKTQPVTSLGADILINVEIILSND